MTPGDLRNLVIAARAYLRSSGSSRCTDEHMRALWSSVHAAQAHLDREPVAIEPISASHPDRHARPKH